MRDCFNLFFRFLSLVSFLAVSICFSEHAYSRENSTQTHEISVTYCVDCVPFHFQDSQGQPAGMMIDLWHIWSEKTGIAITFDVADWGETLDRVKNGQSQVHAGLFYSEERDSYLDYGPVFAYSDTHVFLHRTLPNINSIEDLSGYRTGVLGGDYVETYLKKRLPDDSVVSYTDYDLLFFDLKNGNLKSFAADTPTGIYQLKRFDLLEEFKISESHLLYGSDWRLAVREGNSALLKTLEQGVSKISPAEREEVVQRWGKMVSSEDEAQVIVATEEKKSDSEIIRDHIEETHETFSLMKVVALFLVILIIIIFILWVLGGRPKQLTIRFSLIVIFLVFSCLIISVGALVSFLLDSVTEQSEIENHKYQSLDMALELKQSSDDLTRMARLYAVTGDQRFEHYFKTIISIRNGTRSHPLEFTRSYWDHVIAGTNLMEGRGKKYSFQSKMDELKFTNEERKKIAKAKELSDGLVSIEEEAMNAVKGIYRDKEGRFSIISESNNALAIEMLNS